MALGAALAAVMVCSAFAQDQNQFFANSYALVIGINNYGHSKWPKLNYAVKDAQGFSQFLRSQGFEVIELYERQATRAAILSAVEDQLVPKLTEKDRVVVFFAGHGDTRPMGNSERGYLVPIDGTDSYGSLIPVTQLHDLSSAMSAARHQLFILDSCFGGLAAMRTGDITSTIDPRTPNYVREITRRRARQLLTAGGANQRVRDGGPDGHSYFTGQLLRALNDGTADNNGDGYITFSELSGYIQVAASLYNQTPGTDSLAGHEQGDFLFVNPAYQSNAGTSANRDPAGSALMSSATTDVYEPLRAGKQAWVRKDYVEARRMFLQAADLGNAEAMAYLGKLSWEGWGGPKDQMAGTEWLQKAAERGHVTAMQDLEWIYAQPGPMQNLDEARRWATAGQEARWLQASLTIVDPSGQAGRGEPAIPAEATSVRPPATPTNLTIE
jgi:uncharacterized caspase-like protein